MQRYFCNNKKDNLFILNDNDSNHLIKVMRKNVGYNLEIVYDKTEYICEVIDINNPVKCKIIRQNKTNNKTICSVTIAQSLVKEQKMDYILQKSCELGVDKIIPLNVSRSIINLDKKEDKKIERWQSIMSSASEQSKRNDIPVVEKCMNVDDLIKLDYDYKILCSVNEMSTSIKKVLSNLTLNDTILIVIGPEGGFSNEEENKLISNGFVSVTLGSRVLRTETASLYVLSIINYILEVI